MQDPDSEEDDTQEVYNKCTIVKKTHKSPEDQDEDNQDVEEKKKISKFDKLKGLKDKIKNKIEEKKSKKEPNQD